MKNQKSESVETQEFQNAKNVISKKKETESAHAGLVRLVAPSAAITKDQLNNAVKNLSDMGFYVEHRPDILKKRLLFAGSVERRKKELEWAFQGDNEYIFCVRGGWSSIELCKKLDFSRLDKDKFFVGYSDITALHCALRKHCSKPKLIHCRMPGTEDFQRNRYIEEYGRCLKDQDFSIQLKENQISSEDFQGEIVGGNLQVFSSTIGTPFEIETKGKVLFLEAVNKSPGFIHNTLSHLLSAGKLDNIKALVFGKMHKTEKFSEYEGETYLDYLKEFVEQNLEIPVLYELDIGHSTDMIPIRIGARVTFDSNKRKLYFKH